MVERRELMGAEIATSRVERSSSRVGIESLREVSPSRMPEGSVTFDKKLKSGMSICGMLKSMLYRAYVYQL